MSTIKFLVSKKVISIMSVIIGLVIPALATPVIEFPIKKISVTQRSGSVTIPVKTTGEFYTQPWGEIELPQFTYATQAGTTKSGVGYEGTSGTKYNFSKEDSIIFISIPIFYTGATKDLFFTVVMSDPYYADFGRTTAVTVTIKGEKPQPKISITTDSGRINKDFVVYGKVANLNAEMIKSIKLTIDGRKFSVTGKKQWKSKPIQFKNPGKYQITAKAYLKDGTVIKKQDDLYIY